MFPLHDDNPTNINPVITIGFMVICILTYVWQASLGDQIAQSVVYSFGVIPAVLLDHTQLSSDLYAVPAEITVITSMFMHGGFLHLAGNMLYLWIFGNNVEDSMGHGKFFIFYLLCGVAAALTQALISPQSTIPMIGASGAVSGILGAYLLLYPHAKVLVVVPIIIILKTFRIPAMLVLGLWFGLQLISSANSAPDEGGTAWWAHIGGFIAGMILIPFFKDENVPLFHPAHK
ncbi:MAG: rhomboid family intramembrane serine protease [Gammaproteobacteria bacterium]